MGERRRIPYEARARGHDERLRHSERTDQRYYPREYWSGEAHDSEMRKVCSSHESRRNTCNIPGGCRGSSVGLCID